MFIIIQKYLPAGNKLLITAPKDPPIANALIPWKIKNKSSKSHIVRPINTNVSRCGVKPKSCAVVIMLFSSMYIIASSNSA